MKAGGMTKNVCIRAATVSEHRGVAEGPPVSSARLDARTLIQRICTRAHPRSSQPTRVESFRQHPFSQRIPGQSVIIRGFRIARKDPRGVRRLRGVAGSSPALATKPSVDRGFSFVRGLDWFNVSSSITGSSLVSDNCVRLVSSQPPALTRARCRCSNVRQSSPI